MDLILADEIINRSRSKNHFNQSENSFINNRRHDRPKRDNGGGGGGKRKEEDELDESASSNCFSLETLQIRQEAMLNLVKIANEKFSLFVNEDHSASKLEPTTIEVYLIFLRVGDIDNVKERFQADAYLEASWEDNTVDPSIPFDPKSSWEPELNIENAVANMKQEVTYRVEQVNGKMKVYECRTIKATFWERLELWDFPLDIQNLSILVSSAHPKDAVCFVASSESSSAINKYEFQQQQEWNIYSHIEQKKSVVSDPWTNLDRPCVTFSSTISRKPGYFLYNAYMLIFLITGLGFAPFSFSHTFPHFRIQTTCLLILSSINFRWAVTQKLPAVSYLTTLDKYALGALVFLVLLCVWHAFIGSTLISESVADRIDQIVLIMVAALYALFHLVYMLFFLYKFRRYSALAIQEAESQRLNAAAADNEANHVPLKNAESVAARENTNRRFKLRAHNKTNQVPAAGVTTAI